jgi:hypothetical protein
MSNKLLLSRTLSVPAISYGVAAAGPVAIHAGRRVLETSSAQGPSVYNFALGAVANCTLIVPSFENLVPAESGRPGVSEHRGAALRAGGSWWGPSLPKHIKDGPVPVILDPDGTLSNVTSSTFLATLDQTSASCASPEFHALKIAGFPARPLSYPDYPYAIERQES